MEMPLSSQNRITSYNVCYTKLLRGHLFEVDGLHLGGVAGGAEGLVARLADALHRLGSGGESYNFV